MSKKRTFEELLEDALSNALEDRSKTLRAYDNMKDSLDLSSEESIQKAMLLGPTAVKLLEQLTRSNEQIVRLAQLKEKEESKEKNSKDSPLNLNELLESYPDGDKKKVSKN
jgi:hypothetical protein